MHNCKLMAMCPMPSNHSVEQLSKHARPQAKGTRRDPLKDTSTNKHKALPEIWVPCVGVG